MGGDNLSNETSDFGNTTTSSPGNATALAPGNATHLGHATTPGNTAALANDISTPLESNTPSLTAQKRQLEDDSSIDLPETKLARMEEELVVDPKAWEPIDFQMDI